MEAMYAQNFGCGLPTLFENTLLKNVCNERT